MMDANTRQHLQQEAREEAAQNGSVPYLVAAEDITAWKEGRGLPLPFPFIGDYNPPGFKEKGDRLFVDTSGFGADDEPALTINQLLNRLEPDVAYALVEVGQFQAYLQPFERCHSGCMV